MQIYCPTCRREIPLADVNMATGWAACRACDVLHPLASLLQFAPTSPPTDKRETARSGRVDVDQPAADTLQLSVQPHGPGGLALFALIWNLFIGVITVLLVGVRVGWIEGDLHPPGTPLGIILLMLSPFWLAGAGMVIAETWMRTGASIITIDASELVHRWKWALGGGERRVARTDIRVAHPGTPAISQADKEPSVGVAIRLERGRRVFIPCASADERDHLIETINRFLATTSPTSPTSARA